jgi:hypothetical protein
MARRIIVGGLELDDDRERIDLDAVHGRYERFGFGPPDGRFMGREPGR